MFIFPVQLTTSRIGNFTRLIHTLMSWPYLHIGSRLLVLRILGRLPSSCTLGTTVRGRSRFLYLYPRAAIGVGVKSSCLLNNLKAPNPFKHAHRLRDREVCQNVRLGTSAVKILIKSSTKNLSCTVYGIRSGPPMMVT